LCSPIIINALQKRVHFVLQKSLFGKVKQALLHFRKVGWQN